MQTRDDQMIFEQYQQIDEISIPFSGGKKFGVMNRFKKMLPGQWGKKAKAGINIESDVNHFIELLNNLAHTTGDSTEAIIKSPKFSNWVKNTIKVDPGHIANWSKLVQSGDINNLINAAVIQRNKDHAYGAGHGASSENDAAGAPESTGDTSLTATQSPAAQQAASQTTAAAAPQSNTTPQAVSTGTPQASKGTTVAQSRQAIDAAASAVGSVRSRDRAKLIDYALDKFAAVEGSKPSAAVSSTKPSPSASSIRTKGNVKSAKVSTAATTKESVYIDSNVITENIQFIDCSRF
jgi:hypothetical protein